MARPKLSNPSRATLRQRKYRRNQFARGIYKLELLWFTKFLVKVTP